jgi:hypothetical protein
VTENSYGPAVTGGRIAGTGHFTARGAINDKGKQTTYRWESGAVIILQFVTVGKKGTIMFAVRIDVSAGTSRWKIGYGTKAYKGLHGKGNERENPSYTVSTLTGTVKR